MWLWQTIAFLSSCKVSFVESSSPTVELTCNLLFSHISFKHYWNILEYCWRSFSCIFPLFKSVSLPFLKLPSCSYNAMSGGYNENNKTNTTLYGNCTPLPVMLLPQITSDCFLNKGNKNAFTSYKLSSFLAIWTKSPVQSSHCTT